VNELLVRLNEGSVYAQGYADDICLLAVGKLPNTVSGLIQWALHTVKLWCGGLGLSVNPDKTRLVAFTRKRKLTGFFEPRLFGKTLQCSLSVKYLGVILDSHLTWKEHVDAKVKKAQNLMWACRKACGVTWGLKPRVVHWLYVAIIRPSITFASFVWWPGCQTSSAKRKLSRVQRLACLGIMELCTLLPPMLWKHLSASPHWIRWFKVRLGQLHIDSGVWDVGLTYIPIEDTAAF